jgi:hypothetical protein
MYQLYFEDAFITESDNPVILFDAFTNHLRNELKINPPHYAFVRLDDTRLEIDYGSETNCYYVINTQKHERFENHHRNFRY